MKLKSIPISIKIILSNLIYIAPISIMILIILSVYQTNIDFAEKEKLGNLYENKILNLIENLNKLYEVHKENLLTQKNDQNNFKNEITNVSISQEEFSNVSEKYSSNLNLSLIELKKRNKENLYYRTINNKIIELTQSKIKNTFSKSELFTEYNNIINDLRTLITYTGDSSNLILDPDLDSFYLMDLTLLTLPQTQQYIFEIWNFLNQIENSNSLTPQDRKWFAIKTENLKTLILERLKSDFDSVLKEDINFNGSLKSLTDLFKPKIENFFSELETIIANMDQIEQNNFSLELVKNSIPNFKNVFYQAFKLNHLGLNELDLLLDKRIEAQINSKNENLIYSSIAVIVAALLSTLIGLSIKSEIVKSVSSVVTKLSQIIEQINLSNLKLVKTSVALASDTTEQASAIEETVASTEEMTAMLKQTTTFSKQGLEITQRTIEESEKTKQMTNQLEKAMEEINSSAMQLERIESIINQIQSKTKIINDIVFETRLLSFNASIEAARAGVHGKGFAVVSEEIGKLANLSGNSATEINSLLEKSISEVKNVVNNINSSVSKGVNSFKVTDQNFNQIFITLNSITQSVQAISQATNEQEAGIKQTNIAMHNMDKVTKSNSVNSELLSKEANLINAQINFLNEAMDDLRKVISASNNDNLKSA